jgi:hypothetical protein
MKNRLIHHSAARAPRGGHVTKQPRATQALLPRLAAIAVAFTSLASADVNGAGPVVAPPAKDILASVRLQQSKQDVDLAGQLREEQIVVPFRLTQNGPVIRYSFTNPDEALQLRLGETDSKLEEISRSGVDRISGPEFEQNVRGTAITYEDLALKFLYWPNAQVVGEDSIRTRSCWKLQLQPPGRASQYSNVMLWVDKAGGAFMRMEGYGWDGKLAKRFEVVSAQKIEGRWFLKQMRIEQLQPGTGKVQSRTYLEIKK